MKKILVFLTLLSLNKAISGAEPANLAAPAANEPLNVPLVGPASFGKQNIPDQRIDPNIIEGIIKETLLGVTKSVSPEGVIENISDADRCLDVPEEFQAAMAVKLNLSSIKYFKVSPNSKFVICCADYQSKYNYSKKAYERPNNCFIINLQTGKVVCNFLFDNSDQPAQIINRLVITADNQFVICWSRDWYVDPRYAATKTIKIYNAITGEEIVPLAKQKIDFNSKKNFIANYADNATVDIYNNNTKTLLHSTQRPAAAQPVILNGIASQHPSHLNITINQSILTITNTETNEIVTIDNTLAIAGYWVNFNGKVVAILGGNGLQLWDIKSKKLINSVMCSGVVSCLFSLDNKFLTVIMDQSKVTIVRLDKAILYSLSLLQLKLISWIFTQNSINQVAAHIPGTTVFLTTQKSKLFKSLPEVIQTALRSNYNICDSLLYRLGEYKKTIAASSAGALAVAGLLYYAYKKYQALKK